MGKSRRCDARCHSAKGTICRCWCGGQFHGKGGAPARALLSAAAQTPEGLAGIFKARPPGRQEELSLGKT